MGDTITDPDIRIFPTYALTRVLLKNTVNKKNASQTIQIFEHKEAICIPIQPFQAQQTSTPCKRSTM